ncbi:MAG TPA: PadR family transcriptional regulator [Hyphomonas sp.]|nr:PadR family transcriptional regulator [Hyphomonas sp.]HRJ01251.1 PadR family transcriptional regulator [Hyphomonas sp.]HRK66123.1 PadR family transcriptional regulator [Hyphomonas sp.]
MTDDTLTDIEKRWRKGVLPFAVLAVLGQGPVHGYGLALALRDVLGAAIPEGTLYPLLNGLERDGLAVAEWAIQESGPARKTYVLTDKGREVLAEAVSRWAGFSRKLGKLMP